MRLVDALGHETRAAFDDNDNELSETDALGHTTARTHDARNNKTSETDPLGHTSFWTYDPLGKVLTVKDPLGHLTVNERAETSQCVLQMASGDLLSTTHDLLSTTDAKGNKPLVQTTHVRDLTKSSADVKVLSVVSSTANVNAHCVRDAGVCRVARAALFRRAHPSRARPELTTCCYRGGTAGPLCATRAMRSG